MFIHDHDVGMLAGFADALEDALFVLWIRLIPRLGREQSRGLVRLASGFNTQLIPARPIRSGRSALSNQAGCHRDKGNRALWCLKITWRGSSLKGIPDSG